MKLDNQREKLAGLGPEVSIGGTSQGLRGCLKDLKIGNWAISLVSDLELLLIEEWRVSVGQMGRVKMDEARQKSTQEINEDGRRKKETQFEIKDI